jgi:hypothetical protein
MRRPHRSDGCMTWQLLWPGPTFTAILPLLALSTAACSSETPAASAPAVAPAEELRVLTGSLPFYHLQTKQRNDASGAAFLPDQRRLLVVDDGGDDTNPDLVPLYRTEVAALFSPMPGVTTLPASPEAVAASVSGRHRDLEAATFDGRHVYISSSMPDPAEVGKSDPSFRVLSRFRIEGDTILDVESIEPRPAFQQALARPTADPWFADWLERWSIKRPASKDCGLSLEALSRTPQPGQLLVGLRSPHYGPEYCLEDAQTGRPRTRTGNAILLRLPVTDLDPTRLQASVEATVDLGGLGFRGLEYSPTARGYFITAGAVEAGFDYDFFFWSGDRNASPVRLSQKIPAFARLCRPESVEEVEQDGRRYLLVLSEDSGAICEAPPAPYNYLLIELNRPFLDMLK